MSDRRELARTAIVVALFALMLYYAYAFTVDIGVDDLRAIAPGPIKAEIDRATAGLSPEERQALALPLPEVRRYGDTYLGTAGVIPDEMDAMPWIRENANASDKFVADIFGAEVIMGMTTRVSTEGGDWANAPDPVRLMTDTNEIFKTDDPAKASGLAKGMNATLVYLPRRDLNTGWWLRQGEYNASKFDDGRYFRAVYRTGNVTIYRIL